MSDTPETGPLPGDANNPANKLYTWGHIKAARREGIEAAAHAAENCLHPSAERTAHAAVDDAVAAIRALLTEGER